jgi:hypothetical protein
MWPAAIRGRPLLFQPAGDFLRGGPLDVEVRAASSIDCPTRFKEKDMPLFSDRSLLTMLHGVVLGGAVMLVLPAAMYAASSLGAASQAPSDAGRHARLLARLSAIAAVCIWLSVLVGTYLIFPAYRVVPPDGADLSQYPKSLLQSVPDTVWLHGFAMEVKEHMPWIAAMIMTAVAFIARQFPMQLTQDAQVRRAVIGLMAVVFGLVGFIATLGIFVNKVAPLQ